MPQGTLFTEDFLSEGIAGTDAWREIPPETMAAFRQELQSIFGAAANAAGLNEPQTEERIIQPVLHALGWQGCYSVQERAEVKGRANVPDYLLFGHTHIRLNERDGATRQINPGALHRAAEWTVAVLDVVQDQLRFLKVE